MKARKGSFTIEAACVMSLVLITVMGVLYQSFLADGCSVRGGTGGKYRRCTKKRTDI